MHLQSPVFTFRVSFALVFAVFIIFSCLFSSVHSCHPNDHSSLLDFQNGLSYYASPPLSWSKSIGCCQWEGISCDEDGRVTHLWLPSRGLDGGIPPSISNLTHLSHLNLSHNYLYNDYSYVLPKDMFASLSRLQVLDLSDNSLSGEFLFLAQSMSIRILDFSNNQLEGQIHVPTQFVAPNLTIFRVSGNNFEGEIPASLCVNSNLHVLDLSTNNFSGMNSHKIAKCSNLRELDISGNLLSGSFPDYIFNITTLTHLDISFNNLEGSISQDIGKLAYLKELHLSTNHLVGSIPSSLMNCTRVSWIDLSFNNLSGDFSDLNFSGLTNLHFLDLGNKSFKGELPRSIVQCKSLCVLDLSSNPLLGQNIPSSDQSIIFFASQSLQVLALRGCGLSQIPAWLRNLNGLQVIDMSFNKITGTIPSWLGTLPNLWAIDLSWNQISGHIPPELFNLPQLRSTTELPTWDSCSVPRETWLTYLSLDPLYKQNPVIRWASNRFSVINLSNNKLTGDIPLQRTSLYCLNILDLSFNHLSGRIPFASNQLPYLQQLDVSCNDLQGPVPQVLYSFPLSSFQGNPKLCGFPLPRKCPNTEQGPQAEDKGQELPWFDIGAGFGFMTGFSGVCYSFLFSITWRRAFFNFLISLKDQVYVFVAIRVNRFKQKSSNNSKKIFQE